MARWNWPWAQRSFTQKNPAKWFLEIFGGNKSSSGIAVNTKTALGLTAAWSAIKLLSESVAGLPVQTFKRTDDKKELDRKNPIYTLLHSEPNPLMSSFSFHQSMMFDCLTDGNAYARIHRDGSENVKWLEIIPPEKVTVKVNQKKWYEVDGLANKIPDRNMIHIVGLSDNGIIGKSPIKVCQEAFGLGLAAEEFGAKFFGNGANMTGVLEFPMALTVDQQSTISKSWDKKFSGVDKSGGTAVLEGGMKYNRIGIPPDQAQFILTREFQVTEIARMYNIPPHMIGDLKRSTNANIEQQAIEFVTYSLLPWIHRFEQEYNRKLFREDDKDKFFVEFNLNGLLRADFASRTEGYVKLWGIGAINANQIRALENQNPYEGGDKYFVPMNMTTTDKIGQNEKGNEGI